MSLGLSLGWSRTGLEFRVASGRSLELLHDMSVMFVPNY